MNGLKHMGCATTRKDIALLEDGSRGIIVAEDQVLRAGKIGERGDIAHIAQDPDRVVIAHP